MVESWITNDCGIGGGQNLAEICVLVLWQALKKGTCHWKYQSKKKKDCCTILFSKVLKTTKKERNVIDQIILSDHQTMYIVAQNLIIRHYTSKAHASQNSPWIMNLYTIILKRISKMSAKCVTFRRIVLFSRCTPMFIHRFRLRLKINAPLFSFSGGYFISRECERNRLFQLAIVQSDSVNLNVFPFFRLHTFTSCWRPLIMWKPKPS